MQFGHLSVLLAAMSASASAAVIEERGLSECSSALLDALGAVTDIPTPTGSLSSYLVEQTQLATYTDACVIPPITGSFADEYTSWASEYSSWRMSYQSEVSDVLSACSDVSQVKGQLSSLSASVTWCSSMEWVDASGATAAPKSGTNAAATATQTDSAASTAADAGNAAPRETGMVFAAAAVAGMVVAGIY